VSPFRLIPAIPAMSARVRSRMPFCGLQSIAFEVRLSMATSHSSRRLRNTDLRVDPETRPGWTLPQDHTPRKGDLVYCTEGEAEVARVCGKTSDGNRILELRLLERNVPPFFASASNVLVRAAG